MAHKVYIAIILAVRKGKLKEPFIAADVRRACPEINPTTPGTFLPKHAEGNRRGDSKLFERICCGSYRLLHPIKYGL